MWHCDDWQNARWVESDSSAQMNVICLIWLQPMSVAISGHTPLLVSKLLFVSEVCHYLFQSFCSSVKCVITCFNFFVYQWSVPVLVSKILFVIEVCHHLVWYFSLSVKCAIICFEAFFFQNPPVFPFVVSFSLWGKHGSHSSGFPLTILFVMFWLAETAHMNGSLEPTVLDRSARNFSWFVLLMHILPLIVCFIIIYYPETLKKCYEILLIGF